MPLRPDAAAPVEVPAHVPVYAVDWVELGADSHPVDRHQTAYGELADVLAAALAAEVRAGRVVWGRLADRRTGLVLAEHPPPELHI